MPTTWLVTYLVAVSNTWPLFSLDTLLLAKKYKIPLKAQTRTDEFECQSVDKNNANESTKTLESRYEDIDMADNNVNQIKK